jgi:hypothetical protein
MTNRSFFSVTTNRSLFSVTTNRSLFSVTTNRSLFSVTTIRSLSFFRSRSITALVDYDLPLFSAITATSSHAFCRAFFSAAVDALLWHSLVSAMLPFARIRSPGRLSQLFRHSLVSAIGVALTEHSLVSAIIATQVAPSTGALCSSAIAAALFADTALFAGTVISADGHRRILCALSLRSSSANIAAFSPCSFSAHSFLPHPSRALSW